VEDAHPVGNRDRVHEEVQLVDQAVVDERRREGGAAGGEESQCGWCKDR
jgi:predicted 3-demethylubiquinone-9 3-methyltransferase (glyoxalase superfamily)